MRTVELAMGSVLTALALAIPLAFRGTLQFTIPTVGYSATLASHVPVMLSIVVGPFVAGLVGTASTIGFLATLGPVVAARASSHIIWGVLSALGVRKGLSYTRTLFLVALPIHAVLEGLGVIPFGIPFEGALLNMVGAAIHHTIDSVISIVMVRAVWPLIKGVVRPTKG